MFNWIRHLLPQSHVQKDEPAVAELHESIEVARGARKAADIYVTWLERALTPPDQRNHEAELPS